MRKSAILLSFFLVISAPWISGCGSLGGGTAADYYVKTAADVSNTAALAIEGSQGMALGVYKADQEAIIRMGAEKGWDKEKVKAEIEEVRVRWKPMWDVFEKVRKAHDAVRVAIQAGEAASKLVPLMKNLSTLQAEAAEILKGLKRL